MEFLKQFTSLRLKRPEHTCIPLPILTQAASRGTLYVRIKMVVLASHAGKAQAIFKPSIMVVVINTQAFAAISQGSAVIAGKLMQPVSLQVNCILFVHVIHEVATDTSQNAVGIALAYVDTIAGGVSCTAQITQGKLCLRLNRPMLVKLLLTTIFRTQTYTSIVKSTGNLLALGIKYCEVAVCIINLKR